MAAGRVPKGKSMNVSRRSFLASAAVSAGLMGLAGCSGGGTAGADAMSAPAADKYPIDLDKEGTKAKYTTEELRDGWTRAANEDGGPEVGVADTARLIQVDGYAFRDMDGDGKLSLFEDWRQSADDRAADLASKLSGEDCVKLMWHGGVQGVADAPGVAADPNDTSLLDKGSCAGVSRLGGNEESYGSVVSWINDIQTKCEKRPYGIPYICSVDPYSTLGIPSTVGLAAAMDKDLWRKAGMWIGRAWSAMGIRCELGPQIDLYTHPTVARLNGAETEDPALGRDFTKAFAGGMQSTWGDDEATDDLGWGKDSVGVMLKHFVGAGAIEGGRNDHGDTGKYDVFPGDNYQAHLIPFLDGGMKLDSKTEQMAAVMPNYGIPFSEDAEYGERVGGGLNKKQLSILRNAGWDGMITTDWGIITSGRGTENMTEQERYRMMIDASVDQYGGGFDPEKVGAPVYEQLKKDLGEDEALARVRESARRIFKFMVNTQLFDQPFSSKATAKEIFSNEAAAKFADDCNDQCVIMLKNSGNVVSKDGLGSKPNVYIPQTFTPSSSGFMGTTPASIASCFDEKVAAENFDVVTDTVGAASGAPLEGETEAQFQESDIVRASAEDLADVKYAIVKIKNPQDAYDGVEGATGMFGAQAGDKISYVPISLQYRPYTADGASVRQVSLAGDPADGKTWAEHGTESGVAMENRSYYGKSTHATNESSLDLVIDTKAKLPADAKLILIVDADHPMVFSEVEPYADVILMAWAGDAGPSGSGFNIPDASFARILTGAVEPSGLLPFQMPKDMDTVEAQLEDVPRDMDCHVDADGNTYDFAFGLNWSGVIDDERTKTYKAAPLTKPEAEVIATD